MEKLNFYNADLDYVKFLKKAEQKKRGFSRVPNMEYGNLRKPKFLCGIVLQVNNIDYYVPVTSYTQQKPDNFLIKADNGQVTSSLRFNYMFPIPKELVAERTIAGEPDRAYRALLAQELKYCISCQETIQHLAERTYKRVLLGKDQGLVANSCAFQLLEQECKEYLLKPKMEGAFYMDRIYNGIEDLVGHTPLLRLSRLSVSEGVKAELLVKLEYFNPAGSVKDRAAKQMIEDAEEAGILKPGSVIIEPTSGNTGVGLAALASAKGYRIIIVMPETMSEERRLLIKAHGAELILTDGKKGMTGAIEKAEELSKTVENSWIAGQFTNPSNAKAHYLSTGPEIWEATEGKVDVFVSAVGTGGTLTGTVRYLREKNPGLYVAAVEPAASPVLSGGQAGPHKIQGIGAGFIPDILDTQLYQEILLAEDEEAFRMSRLLAEKEGILAGISSGAALWAAVQLGKRPELEGKRIVAVLPDTGERYLSTPLFRE